MSGTWNSFLCSDECKRIRANKKVMEKYYKTKVWKVFKHRICKICGVNFVATTHNQESCSIKCSKINLQNIAKLHYTNNAETIKLRVKLWYAKPENKIKNKEWLKSYRKTTKGRIAKIAGTQAYRLRLKNTKKGKVDYAWINERDGFKCQLCFKKVDMTLRKPDMMRFSYDHIVPVSKGGEHTTQNNQLSHLICNLIKHAKLSDLIQQNLL